MAGNQLGKTFAGGAEVAYHLTGKYPDWWDGKRFDGPTKGWVAGVTGESTRDNPQRILIGEPEKEHEWGTGSIPKKDIVKTQRAVGSIANLLDSVTVKHISGGESVVKFKAYEKGRAKWQGETLHFVWFDEEPPMPIYTEGMTRTNTTKGITFITATPLLGCSEVILRFLGEDQLQELQKKNN